jgi:hypothetical protein
MWRDGFMLQPHRNHQGRRFRLVVETDDPALAISDFASFTAAGFDVVCCGGPGNNDPCPVVEGRVCPVVEDSDVVLNQLKGHQTQHAVVDGVHRTSPSVPLVVAMAPDGFEHDLPDGCVSLAPLTSVNGQTFALRRAVVRGR